MSRQSVFCSRIHGLIFILGMISGISVFYISYFFKLIGRKDDFKPRKQTKKLKIQKKIPNRLLIQDLSNFSIAVFLGLFRICVSICRLTQPTLRRRFRLDGRIQAGRRKEGFLPGCNGIYLYFEQTIIGCLSTPHLYIPHNFYVPHEGTRLQLRICVFISGG